MCAGAHNDDAYATRCASQLDRYCVVVEWCMMSRTSLMQRCVVLRCVCIAVATCVYRYRIVLVPWRHRSCIRCDGGPPFRRSRIISASCVASYGHRPFIVVASWLHNAWRLPDVTSYHNRSCIVCTAPLHRVCTVASSCLHRSRRLRGGYPPIQRVCIAVASCLHRRCTVSAP